MLGNWEEAVRKQILLRGAWPYFQASHRLPDNLKQAIGCALHKTFAHTPCLWLGSEHPTDSHPHALTHVAQALGCSYRRLCPHTQITMAVTPTSLPWWHCANSVISTEHNNQPLQVWQDVRFGHSQKSQSFLLLRASCLFYNASQPTKG